MGALGVAGEFRGCGIDRVGQRVPSSTVLDLFYKIATKYLIAWIEYKNTRYFKGCSELKRNYHVLQIAGFALSYLIASKRLEPD